MKDEVIELKPGMYGVAVDLRAAWRRLSQGREATPGLDVAARFLRLFDDHGVSRGRIPSLIEGLSYRAVDSADSLLAELRREHLIAAACLLRVELAWLEGAQQNLYALQSCSKSPDRFFGALQSLSSPHALPLRALATTRNLDRSRRKAQRVTLVLVESAPLSHEQLLDRYVPFADAWDWSHPPCRLQLKAMVRAYGRPVPIHEVDQSVIEAITNGERVPREAAKHPFITEPSLEDYCLSRDENFKAREEDELVDVRAYAHRERIPWNTKAWQRELLTRGDNE
jgi:hypothetical protein